MKTKIHISGQIGGNFKLRNAIITANCTEKKGMFNSFILEFATKKEAVQAIRDAHNSLKNEYPEMAKQNIGGLSVSTDRTSLYWDASKATIN